MISRDFKYLKEELRLKYYEWVILMDKAKLNHIITCTGRTMDVQMAYFLRGRASLKLVHYYYKYAGLNEIITEAQNKYAITWTLESRHLIAPPDKMVCSAFDFVIAKDGIPVWSGKADVNKNQIPDYEEAGKLAEKVGLEAGAFWTKPDYCHIQLKS